MAQTRIEGENPLNSFVTEQARDRAIRRFMVMPEPHEIPAAASRALVDLRDHVIELGALIDVACPDSMNKSLALRHLEDAHTRAVRAIWGDIA